MSQKKHLDLLCFVFPIQGKGCRVHLFVKKNNNKIMTNLIKSRSIPPMGALRPIPDPLPFFAYTSFKGKGCSVHLIVRKKKF